MKNAQSYTLQRLSLIALSGVVIVGFLLGLMQFAVITARATRGDGNLAFEAVGLYQDPTPPIFASGTPPATLTPGPPPTATPTPNPYLRQQCASLIQNGNFEDTALMSLWHYSQSDEHVTRTSVVRWLAPGESFSMFLPASNVGGVPRHPWLYQEFVLPSWVLTPAQETGSKLTLSLHVGLHPEGAPEPDPLYVALLDQSGLITLTEPITIATGADTPVIYVNLPNNNDWIYKTIDLANHFNLVDYKNQTLRLHFYSPNPNGTYTTRFFLDNVGLTLCTTQDDSGLSLTIDPPRSTTVSAGETLTLTHVLTYAGRRAIPDVLNLTADSASWPPIWSPLTTTLTPGQPTPVTVNLSAPIDAADFALNVLTLTVTGPGSLSDSVIDTVTVAAPQRLENEVTLFGVSQPVITLTAGASVVWRNQTSETHRLAPTCADLLPAPVIIYLPLVLKSAGGFASSGPVWLSTTPISATIAAGGTYTHTFTAAGSFDYCVSSALAQTNSVIVLPGPPADFRLAVTPHSQTVTSAQGAPYDLHLNALYGFSQPVSLSLSGLPGSAQIEPPVVVSPTSKTRLIITPSLSVAGGTHPLAALAQSGSISHSVPLSLTVLSLEPDFAINVMPLTQTTVLEQETSLLVELTALNGFTAPLTLTVTQAPTETLTRFAVSPVIPSANTVLTVTATASAPLGLHPLTIQATSGHLTHTATAVLSITHPNLDVAIVLDRSGSMEFDPVSYGNWERTQTPQEPNPSGNPVRWADYFTYPANGVIYPVGYNDGDDSDGGFGHPLISGPGGVCDTSPANLDDFTYIEDGNHYIVMEAELYSYNNTTADPVLRETGKGYWALQRGEGNYGETPPYYTSTGTSLDARPAHMAHHPSLTSYTTALYGFHYSLSHAQNNDAPLLEYDFKFRNGSTFNWSGNAYVWVRVHAGRGLDVDDNNFGDTVGPSNDIYWTLVPETDDGDLAMDAIGFNPNTIKPAQNIPNIPINNGTGWHWVRLQDPVAIDTTNIYRLYIYAGAAGISIDRIAVTDNATTNPGNLPTGVRDGTITATTGSGFRAACSPCNVIYGENIGVVGSGTPYELDDCGPTLPYAQPIDQSLDPIFADFENPMRSAKEAVKLFVTKLDPEKDQVGFVSYTTGSNVGTGNTDIYKTELACLRRVGVYACNAPTISYTHVLRDIEDVSATASTNTGAGMKAGLEVLGIDLYNVQPPGPTNCGGNHCSRGASAQRIMILLTDGIPNADPNGACDDTNPGNLLPIGAAPDNGAHRCPLYFAQQAAYRGVTVYVIGLGYGVNSDYLKAVAELGGGQYYFSASGADLDLIYNEIKRTGLPQGPNHCEVLPLAIQEDALTGLSEGDILSAIQQGAGSGNFLFTRWRDGNSAVPWITALTNSEAYLTAAVEHPWLSQVDYLNPTDATDYALEIGDMVWVFAGQIGSSAVTDALITRRGQFGPPAGVGYKFRRRPESDGPYHRLHQISAD